MKVEQIENTLKNRNIEFNLNYSGISKSVYFSFQDAYGNDLTIRVSNHDLPAGYQGRTESFSRDFRFTDKMSDISAYIENTTGKKIVRTARVKRLLSAEDSAYIRGRSAWCLD